MSELIFKLHEVDDPALRSDLPRLVERLGRQMSELEQNVQLLRKWGVALDEFSRAIEANRRNGSPLSKCKHGDTLGPFATPLPFFGGW